MANGYNLVNKQISLLKGLVSREEYFLRSYKSNYTFCLIADGFHTFKPFFMKKIKNTKFLLAFIKSLTNPENPFSNPL